MVFDGARLRLTALALALAAPTAARAAVTLESAIVFDERGGASEGRATVFVDGGALRFDVEREGKRTAIIYREVEDRIWILDVGKQTYAQLTRTEALELKTKLDGLRYAMLKNAQGLSEEKRRALMRTLEGVATGPEQPAVAMKKDGAREQVAGRRCQPYTAAEPVMDVCLAPLAAAGISEADFLALVKLGHVVAYLSRDADALFKFRKDGDVVARELPLRVVRRPAPGSTVTARVTAVRQGRIDPALFTLPAAARRAEPPLR